jgi:hypothetical protein
VSSGVVVDGGPISGLDPVILGSSSAVPIYTCIEQGCSTGEWVVKGWLGSTVCVLGVVTGDMGLGMW